MEVLLRRREYLIRDQGTSAFLEAVGSALQLNGSKQFGKKLSVKTKAALSRRKLIFERLCVSTEDQNQVNLGRNWRLCTMRHILPSAEDEEEVAEFMSSSLAPHVSTRQIRQLVTGKARTLLDTTHLSVSV